MTAPRPVPHSAPPTAPPTPSVRTPRVSRRAALALAGGAVGVLAIGWLADLFAVAPLTTTPAGPLTRQVGLYHVTLDLRPTPPRLGTPTAAAIAVVGADGTPLAGMAVEVAATMVAMDMRIPTQRTSEHAAPARYACTLVFSMTGTWRVDVRFGQSGATPLTASFDVTVR